MPISVGVTIGRVCPVVQESVGHAPGELTLSFWPVAGSVGVAPIDCRKVSIRCV